jgi:hypothetical protein
MIIPLFLTLNLLGAVRPPQMPDEYQVKAAFLYNFAKFVEWPLGAFQNPGQSLVICVLGEDPFGRALDEVVEGKKIDGRPIGVRRISDAREAGGCQVLFVSSSEGKRALSVLDGGNGSGVLTVGESTNATSGGMIINFVLEGGRIRFTINPAAARRGKLRVSSRLLSLAIIEGK